jgi:hypothetical protein
MAPKCRGWWVPAEGVVVRHRRGCASGGGEACTCRPGFQAQVWSPRDRRPIRRTFATVGEAKRWRRETQVAVHQQLARAPSQRTLREAADEWLVAARAGRQETNLCMSMTLASLLIPPTLRTSVRLPLNCRSVAAPTVAPRITRRYSAADKPLHTANFRTGASHRLENR